MLVIILFQSVPLWLASPVSFHELYRKASFLFTRFSLRRAVDNKRDAQFEFPCVTLVYRDSFPSYIAYARTANKIEKYVVGNTPRTIREEKLAIVPLSYFHNVAGNVIYAEISLP